MRKYTPLVAFLQAQTQDSVTLSFGQIDKLVGGLPRSAREHQAWWGNSRTEDTHTWAHLWIAAGWERGALDMPRELVTFTRGSVVAKPARPFWWVNHKKTHRAEIDGGYIWSPKTNSNGSHNQTYENLTLARPGDVVFSYAGAAIRAVGVVQSRCHEQRMPAQYDERSDSWDGIGWRVPIQWIVLASPIEPRAHLEQIVPLLPEKYSPIRHDGLGNQKCYLAGISAELGSFLLGLSDQAAEHMATAESVSEIVIEQGEAASILFSNLKPTVKEQLINARVGQGEFRQQLLKIERACRLTGIADERFLIASHIKPWRDSDNTERLDGSNGLMLSPHADKLFDRGWISFSDNGDLLVSCENARGALDAWGISTILNVGTFTSMQQKYLSFHRQFVFRGLGASS